MRARGTWTHCQFSSPRFIDGWTRHVCVSGHYVVAGRNPAGVLALDVRADSDTSSRFSSASPRGFCAGPAASAPYEFCDAPTVLLCEYGTTDAVVERTLPHWSRVRGFGKGHVQLPVAAAASRCVVAVLDMTNVVSVFAVVQPEENTGTNGGDTSFSPDAAAPPLHRVCAPHFSPPFSKLALSLDGAALMSHSGDSLYRADLTAARFSAVRTARSLHHITAIACVAGGTLATTRDGVILVSDDADDTCGGACDTHTVALEDDAPYTRGVDWRFAGNGAVAVAFSLQAGLVVADVDGMFVFNARWTHLRRTWVSLCVARPPDL